MKYSFLCLEIRPFTFVLPWDFAKFYVPMAMYPNHTKKYNIVY